MIRSFRGRETEKVFRREFSRQFDNIGRVALRKLTEIHAATSLRYLAAVPGHRLEALAGDLYSIRIND